MKFSREQFSLGFQLIAVIGFLLGEIVIPEQVVSGQIRLEPKVGVIVSLVFALLAGIMLQSFWAAVLPVVQATFIASAMWLVVVPFVASEAGWSVLFGVAAIALFGIAICSFLFMLWLNKHGAQQGVQAYRP